MFISVFVRIADSVCVPVFVVLCRKDITASVLSCYRKPEGKQGRVDKKMVNERRGVAASCVCVCACVCVLVCVLIVFIALCYSFVRDLQRIQFVIEC